MWEAENWLCTESLAGANTLIQMLHLKMSTLFFFQQTDLSIFIKGLNRFKNNDKKNKRVSIRGKQNADANTKLGGLWCYCKSGGIIN